MAISTKDKDVLERGKPSAEKRSGDGVTRVRPGVADYLAGESSVFQSNLTPYLPNEVIGGAVPHIPGSEEEAVWNAASQACSTERVHYCYSVEEGRIWYLATPSAALASNPDSWCPLAAARRDWLMASRRAAWSAAERASDMVNVGRVGGAG